MSHTYHCLVPHTVDQDLTHKETRNTRLHFTLYCIYQGTGRRDGTICDYNRPFDPWPWRSFEEGCAGLGGWKDPLGWGRIIPPRPISIGGDKVGSSPRYHSRALGLSYPLPRHAHLLLASDVAGESHSCGCSWRSRCCRGAERWLHLGPRDGR